VFRHGGLTFKTDIDLLEGVQKRVTKLITSLKDKTYEERIRVLNLQTLETMIIRGDFIGVFKIFEGFENSDPSMFFFKIEYCTN